jgi:hypothetical protein
MKWEQSSFAERVQQAALMRLAQRTSSLSLGFHNDDEQVLIHRPCFKTEFT